MIVNQGKRSITSTAVHITSLFLVQDLCFSCKSVHRGPTVIESTMKPGPARARDYDRNRTSRSVLVARAILPKSWRLGLYFPDSSRAIADWRVPIFLANWAWVNPLF